jgi:hypothetical protein
VPRRGRAVVQVRGVLNTGLVGRPAFVEALVPG